MPTYKLHKNRKPRRVTVQAERIDIHVPALIVCAVLAFFIWLYIVSFAHLPDELPGDTNPPATEASTTVQPQPAALPAEGA